MRTSTLRPSRRTIAALVLVALIATAGCIADPAGDSGDEGNGSPTPDTAPAPDAERASDGASLVQYLPADTDLIQHVDGELLRDEETFAILEHVARTGPGEPSPDPQASLEASARRYGLELSDVHGAIVFGRWGPSAQSQDSGMLVHVDMGEQQLVSAIERSSGRTFTEAEYAGHTVYRLPDAAERTGETGQAGGIGVLGDGRYVVGTDRTVHAVLDVAAGNAAPASGRLVELFESSPDGLFTSVMLLPDDPARMGTFDEAQVETDLGPFQDVEAVSTTYATPNGTVSSDVRLVFGSEQRASTAATAVEAGLGRVAESTSQESIPRQLESVTVETSGTTVSLSHTASPEAVAELYLGPYLLGFGSETGPESPQVRWIWEQRGEEVVLRHGGGDTVQPGTLHVENEDGEVLVPAAEIDEPLAAGDTVPIDGGAQADRLRLVWRGDGATAVVSTFDIES